MKKTSLFAAMLALTAAAVQAAPGIMLDAETAETPAPGQQLAGYCDWVTTFETGGERPAWCADTETGTGAGASRRSARA